MKVVSNTMAERVNRLRSLLMPHGFNVRKAGTQGLWIVEHPITKRKVRFWPRHERWCIWFNEIHGGGLLIPKGMPTGRGIDSLCTRLIAEIQQQPHVAA